MSVIRHFVSKKKRRFQQHGFDLDLTYITDNIVAMGYPSEKLEGFVRNKAEDVIKFFDVYHPDSYKVYNLCSERKYDPSKFHNRVAEYPFEDHNAPRFEMLKPCCEDIQDWLAGNDERNVVAIHCKAGKGRTGVIICSYLLHNGAFTDTKEALQFYGERRTQNAKGVTIPSQRRYVYYYSYMIRKKLTYTPTPLLLKSITLIGIPSFSNGICTPMFIVRQGQGAKIYQSEPHQEVKKTDREIKIILPKPLPICGDLRIEFLHVSKLNKKEKMFQYWFNTFFIFHSCPTEEQELIDANSNCTHSMPPTIPETSEAPVHKHHKKPPQTSTEGESISSLPLPKSSSSSSLTNEDKACSPELVPPPGIGLTKKVRQRGSIRRSVSEVPVEAINPVYCDEFNLNLPKWELDRAHKDKDCKQYPDSFRVVTSVSNPLSQDQVEFEVDSIEQDQRHELVDYNSGMSEDDDDDDDDDDVRDGSEVMGISLKKKESTNSVNSHSSSKTSHSSHKNEDKPKKYSKSAENNVGHVEKRSHSNAITSPTIENGPKSLDASTTHQPEGPKSSDTSTTHQPEGPKSSDASTNQPEGPKSSDASTNQPEGPKSSDASTNQPEGPKSSDASTNQPEGPKSSDTSTTHQPEGPKSPDASTNQPEGPKCPDASTTHQPEGPKSSDASTTHQPEGPKSLDASTTDQPKRVHFSPSSNDHNPNKPPIPPKSNPSPNREALTTNRKNPGDKRPSELSL